MSGNIIEGAIKETRDRVRRIETRLTSYIESQGVKTDTLKPELVTTPFQPTFIQAHKMGMSIGDIIDVVPETLRHTDIPVFVKDTWVFTIRVGHYSAAKSEG